jgi:peptide/nickel transport system substrate-binding protein
MMGRIGCLLVILSFILMPASTFAGPKDTYTWAIFGTTGTLDPAKAYDDASMGVLWNVYETLIWYDGDKTEKFIPVLAQEVPTVETVALPTAVKPSVSRSAKGLNSTTAAS